MKKIAFILILVLLIFIDSSASATYRDGFNSIKNSLIDSGAKLTYQSTKFEGYINSPLKASSLNQYLKDGLKNIEGNRIKKEKGLSSSSNLNIKFKIIRIQKENMYFIVVILSQRHQIRNINSIIGKIKHIYNELGAIPNINYGFEGIINKKLSKQQMKNKACEILIENRCKNASLIWGDNMISVTGLTPFIITVIRVNDSYVNLNIALRYVDEQKVTKLWAYSPLIQTEY